MSQLIEIKQRENSQGYRDEVLPHEGGHLFGVQTN